MKIEHKIHTLFFAMLLLFAHQLQAKNIHSLLDIQAQAHKYIVDKVEDSELLNNYKDVKVIPGRLNSRLALTQCEQPLNLKLAHGTINNSRVTVKVRCDKPVQWALNIPIKIHRYLDLVVI